MFTDTIGRVTDSSVAVFSRIPFLDIEYPIPYKLVDYNKKNVRNTSNDIIKTGLNIYDIIMDIKIKDNVSEKMNSIEENELKDLLRGGVIYNGSTN